MENNFTYWLPPGSNHRQQRGGGRTVRVEEKPSEIHRIPSRQARLNESRSDTQIYCATEACSKAFGVPVSQRLPERQARMPSAPVTFLSDLTSLSRYRPDDEPIPRQGRSGGPGPQASGTSITGSCPKVCSSSNLSVRQAPSPRQTRQPYWGDPSTFREQEYQHTPSRLPRSKDGSLRPQYNVSVSGHRMMAYQKARMAGERQARMMYNSDSAEFFDDETTPQPSPAPPRPAQTDNLTPGPKPPHFGPGKPPHRPVIIPIPGRYIHSALESYGARYPDLYARCGKIVACDPTQMKEIERYFPELFSPPEA